MPLLDIYFQKKAQQYNYKIDSSQEYTITQLSNVSTFLCSNKKSNIPPCYYLWGPVGRGKSWLLNTFFEAVSIPDKKRFHFHSFFKQLHQKNFEYSHYPNSFRHAVNELLDSSRLICFDEFHVHDISDAMMITELFKILFEQKVAVVTTSNYEPESLLPNPLYHERFVPTIKLIKKHMSIINVTGKTDYRTLPQTHKQGFSAGYYISPASSQQRLKYSLAPYNKQTKSIQVANRALHPVQFTDNHIVFNFQDLCETNTSSADYLTLMEHYQTWVIDNVPLLSTTTIDAQQRFANLIDILYDQNKCLYILALQPLQETLANTAISDMIRTLSRLSQLQKC